MYARIGHPHCPTCGEEIKKLSNEEILNFVLGKIKSIDKSKKNSVGLVTEGSNIPDANMKRYAISRVMGPLSIVDIKKIPKEKTKSYSNEDFVGTIVLRLDSQQLAELKVVEKAGELLLFPFDEYEDESNQKIRMDEVLPQFNSVKELRGGE